MKKTLFTFLLLFLAVVSSESQWIDDHHTISKWITGSSTDANGNSYMKLWGGNVFITFSSFLQTSTYSSTIVTIKFDGNLVEQWRAVYPQSSNTITASGIDVDLDGNVCVAASRYNGVNYDYVTLKYDGNSGSQLWEQDFDGNGDDFTGAIGVDNNRNVYVTGSSYHFNGLSTTDDITTICYYGNGLQKWIRFYDGWGHGSDNAWSIAIDNDPTHIGNGVYLAGTADNGFNCPPPTGNCYHDAQVVHYTFDGGFINRHGPDESHYGCDDPNEDWANQVIVSSRPAGDVYAVGAKRCLESGYTYPSHEFFVFRSIWDIKHDPPFYLDPVKPTYCDNSRYYLVDGGENAGNSIALDANDNIIATGMSEGYGTGSDILTMKLRHDGTQEVVQRYNSGGANYDVGNSIAINSEGNIFITGTTNLTSFSSSNLILIQYDQNLNFVCSSTYDGTLHLGDHGSVVCVDANHIYVTGSTNITGGNSSSDAITFKYTETNINSCSNDGQNSSTKESTDLHPIPTMFGLSQNYPNPFNPTTNIKYSIPRSSFVSMKIYDILGHIMLTFDGKLLVPGNYSEQIDAASWATGIYFYTIDARDVENSSNVFKETKKMLLIK